MLTVGVAYFPERKRTGIEIFVRFFIRWDGLLVVEALVTSAERPRDRRVVLCVRSGTCHFAE